MANHKLYTPNLNSYPRPESWGLKELKKAGETSVLGAALMGHLETSQEVGGNQLSSTAQPDILHFGLADIYPQAEYMAAIQAQLPVGRQIKAQALSALAEIWSRGNNSGLINYEPASGCLSLLGAPVEELEETYRQMSSAGWSRENNQRPGLTLDTCPGDLLCPWPLTELASLNGRIYETLQETGYDLTPEGLFISLSGCAKDCSLSLGRADLAVIGVWSGNIAIDNQKIFDYVGKWEETIQACPTFRLNLVQGEFKQDENKPCLACGRCLRRMPEALAPPLERGLAIMAGGRSPMHIPPKEPWFLTSHQNIDSQAVEDGIISSILNIADFWLLNKRKGEFLFQTINRLGLGKTLAALKITPSPKHLKTPASFNFR